MIPQICRNGRHWEKGVPRYGKENQWQSLDLRAGGGVSGDSGYYAFSGIFRDQKGCRLKERGEGYESGEGIPDEGDSHGEDQGELSRPRSDSGFRRRGGGAAVRRGCRREAGRGREGGEVRGAFEELSEAAIRWGGFGNGPSGFCEKV